MFLCIFTSSLDSKKGNINPCVKLFLTTCLVKFGYICTFFTFFHFFPSVPPTIRRPPLNMAVQEDSPAILSCQVSGTPYPVTTVIWEKDGQLIRMVSTCTQISDVTLFRTAVIQYFKLSIFHLVFWKKPRYMVYLYL